MATPDVIRAAQVDNVPIPVTAKFRLTGVKRYLAEQWDNYAKASHEMPMADLEFQAVGPKQDTPEDQAFWKSTPSGQIKISVANPSAVTTLLEHLGGEFYVSFVWDGVEPKGKVHETVEQYRS
jgi:hypothetical protein